MEPWRLVNTADWEPYRVEIFGLYYDKGLTLAQVSRHMENLHGLKATERQYKRLLKKSGRQKNSSCAQWAYIGDIVRKRGSKDSEVLIDGEVIGPGKLNREIRRYRLNVQRPSVDSLPRIVVRTPDPQSPVPAASPSMPHENISAHLQAVASYDPSWKLIREDTIGWSEVQVDEDIRSELSWSSIYVPSEAMSDDDGPPLEILSRKYRKILVRGTSAGFEWGYFEIDDSTISSVNLESFVNERRFASPMIASPNLSWLWDSLKCALSQDYAEQGSKHDLRICSRTKLLEMAIQVVLRRVGPRKAHGALPRAIGWFSEERSVILLRQLLQTGLSKSPILRAFAKSLPSLALIYFYESNSKQHPPTQEGRQSPKGVMTVVFWELMKLDQSKLSLRETEMLYCWYGSHSFPSETVACVRRGLSLETILRPYERAFNLLYSNSHDGTIIVPSILFPDVIKTLSYQGKDHQAVFEKVLQVAYDMDVEGMLSAFPDVREKVLAVCRKLMESVDLNAPITSFTIWPFNLAELAVIKLPFLRPLFETHVRSPLSSAILNIYTENPNVLSPQIYGCSTAQSSILIHICYSGPSTGAQMLLQAGADPNCAIVYVDVHDMESDIIGGLPPSREGIKGLHMERVTECRLHGAACSNELRARLTRQWPKGVELTSLSPLALAIRRRDNILAQCLLDHGADVTDTCIDLIHKLASAHVFSGSELDTASAAFFGSLRIPPGTLRRMNLCPSFQIHLMRHAILNGDADRIQKLKNLCPGFEGDRTFSCERHSYQEHDIHPQHLLFSLHYATLDIVKLVWELGAGFLEGTRNAGASELRLLCSMVKSAETNKEGQRILAKLQYILDHLASVNPGAVSMKDDPQPLHYILSQNLIEFNDYATRNDFIGLGRAFATHFLQTGAAVDSVDMRGMTPIHLAAHSGNVDLIEYLVGRGANLNIRSDDSSPLAAICGCKCWYSQNQVPDRTVRYNLYFVQYFVTHGALLNPESSGELDPLSAACESGLLEVVQLLIELGADVNQQSGQHNHTALHRAASSGNLEILRALVEAGATVNPDFPYETPLHLTYSWTKSDSVAMAELLVTAGADIDSWAVHTQKFEDRLRWNEFPPDSKPVCVFTPLCLAVFWENLDLVLFLILNGAKIDATELLHDRRNRYVCIPPIFVAAWGGSYDVVQVLLNACGTGVSAGTWTIKNALQIALRRNHEHIASLLQDHIRQAESAR